MWLLGNALKMPQAHAQLDMSRFLLSFLRELYGAEVCHMAYVVLLEAVMLPPLRLHPVIVGLNAKLVFKPSGSASQNWFRWSGQCDHPPCQPQWILTRLGDMGNPLDLCNQRESFG